METKERVGHTPGPWKLCYHLESPEQDGACPCGYRGVIYGPDNDGISMAICQPGHDVAPGEEAGTEPQRYPREVELANARLIAACPELLDVLRECSDFLHDFTEEDSDAVRLARMCREVIRKATKGE